MFIFRFEGAIIVPKEENNKTQPRDVAEDVLQKENLIAVSSQPFKGNEKEKYYAPMLKDHVIPKFGVFFIGYEINQFRS